MSSLRRFTVFVGGMEVNDFELSWEEAERLFRYYVKQGYDDARIVELKVNHEFIA